MFRSFHLRSNMLVLVAVVLMIISSVGCAAVPPAVPMDDVWALSEPSTIAGARAVVDGIFKFGQAMQKDGILVVMWPIDKMGWASVFIDTSKLAVVTDKAQIFKLIGQAGIFNSKNMGDFTLALESNGFMRISLSQLPTVFITAINSVKSVPVLVLPAGLYKSSDDLMPVEIKQ